MIIKFKRLSETATIPCYAHEGDSGMDLCADIDRAICLVPLKRTLVPLGWAIEIPPGYEGQVRPRSGQAFKKGLGVINSPGTIDSGYRGEMKVPVINLNRNVSITIEPRERIAQLVICPVAYAEIEEVAALSTSTRGTGGFGSTGK